jgi:hypothetical protein
MLKQIFTNPTFLSIINGQLRHLATVGGTALAANGWIGGDQVEVFAGAAVTLAAMVLSAVSKKLAA